MIKSIDIKLTALIILSTLTTSCEYINVLSEDGEIINKQQTVEDVKYIIVEASCHIELHNQISNTIEIKGFDYLIDDLVLDYRNDSLIIKHNHNYLQKSKLILLQLSGRKIKRITVNKPSQISTYETLTCNDFSMVMNGGSQFTESNLDLNCEKLRIYVYGDNNIGKHTLAGRADDTFYTLEGRATINSLNLNCNQSSIIHKSIGDCDINVKTKLDVKSYSSGNTKYKGSPEIKYERMHVPYLTSTGELIKIQ